MFSGIYRRITTKIPEFIFNLKKLFANNLIDEIPSLYFSNKIEEQRTLHLKVLKLHSEKKSLILKNLYLTNPTYNLMIKDLLKDFKDFNTSEICDFLSWYRRSIAIGCVGIISQSEFDSISTVIKNRVLDPKDFFSIKTTLFFNFGTLNLQNEHSLGYMLKGTYNIKIKDIKQILYIMNLNPELNSPLLFEIVIKNMKLAFNRLTSLSDQLGAYKNYLLYCQFNNIEPDKNMINSLDEFLDLFMKLAPKRIFEIVNDIDIPSLKQSSLKFHKKLINHSNDNFNDPKVCTDYARFVSCEYSEDNRMVKDAFDQTKYQIKLNHKFYNISMKSDLLMDMTKTQYKDLDLADLCVETELHPYEYKKYFLLNFVYYHEITGRSLLEKLKPNESDLIDIPKICQQLDFGDMNNILKTFITYPCKSYTMELVQKLICAEIIHRSKNDLQIARYYYMVCGLTAKTSPNEFLSKLLKDLQLCIACLDLSSKTSKNIDIAK